MADLWMDVDAALSEVPINLFPLIDDTDFKSIEASVVYNQAGLALKWNFVTTAGAFTQTAVTPTNTGGNYDFVNQGGGLYTIEIPASGGASINNDTEGCGWFTGVATGILPWRGPVIGFRAAGLNDALIDSAWSATRGLAGTALPAAAADAAGGLPISDAGGLDMDAILARIGAFTGSGVNTILGFFKALFSSDASTPSDIGGTYDPATMSLEGFYGNALVATDIADATLTRVMTESYSTLTATKTPAQALYEICQILSDFSISGTTITIKKIDGTTTAFTHSLDSATAPITSRGRAT